MTDGNVQSSRGVTLVGGGAPSKAAVQKLMEHAPDLVAADGGANECVSFGFSPIAVVGDFDSLTSETRSALPETRFVHVAEQDSTDFNKCLTNIEAPFILATGFTAARVDHTLAVLSELVQHDGAPVIILGEEDVIFAAPTHLSLDLAMGLRLSLFPMCAVEGTSSGLEWPIDGLVLEPDGRIGTSNRVTGPVTLSFKTRGCLVILPAEALPTVLQALTG